MGGLLYILSLLLGLFAFYIVLSSIAKQFRQSNCPHRHTERIGKTQFYCSDCGKKWIIPYSEKGEMH